MLEERNLAECEILCFFLHYSLGFDCARQHLVVVDTFTLVLW